MSGELWEGLSRKGCAYCTSVQMSLFLGMLEKTRGGLTPHILFCTLLFLFVNITSISSASPGPSPELGTEDAAGTD